MAGKVDALQRCIMMIEAIADMQSEIRNFRTHCNDIVHCAQMLHPLLMKAQKEAPGLSEAPAASQVINKVTDLLEEALYVIRKASNISQIEKFMDRGELKGKLDDILASLQQAARETDSFVVDFMRKMKSLVPGESSKAE